MQGWSVVSVTMRLYHDFHILIEGHEEAQKALDSQVTTKYSKLTTDEIKTLVVDDKWMARLAADVQSELDRVSQALTGRIRQVAERYATPLQQLTDEVATLAARVDEHLNKMGF